MPDLITDHLWRPAPANPTTLRGMPPRADRPCEYMSCRRPRAEHERAVSGKWSQ